MKAYDNMGKVATMPELYSSLLIFAAVKVV